MTDEPIHGPSQPPDQGPPASSTSETTDGVPSNIQEDIPDNLMPTIDATPPQTMADDPPSSTTAEHGSAVTSQTPSESQPPWIIEEVLEAVTVTQNKKRYYKVKLKGQKPGTSRPWVFEDAIPPDVLAVFRRNKTLTGRARKRRKLTFCIRK